MIHFSLDLESKFNVESKREVLSLNCCVIFYWEVSNMNKNNSLALIS